MDIASRTLIVVLGGSWDATVAVVSPGTIATVVIVSPGTIAIVAIVPPGTVALATVAVSVVASVATVALVIGCLFLLVCVIIVRVIGLSFRSVVGRTRKTAASCNSSASHDSLSIVRFELCDLVTLLPLAACLVSTAVRPGRNTCAAEYAAVILVVALIVKRRIHTGALVLVRVPIAVAEVVSVRTDPSVHALG